MTSPLSSMPVSPDANASEISRKELQDKLNGLGGISGRKLDPEAKAKKLREACEGFESIFIQKMWQEMRNTVPKGGLMQGKEEKFWQDMYDQELSKSMTKAGGIGLADMMYEQLSRNLASASRTTIGNGAASPFAPGAAPLVSPEADYESALGSPETEAEHKPAQAASIYEGEAPEAADSPVEEEQHAQIAPEPERAAMVQPQPDGARLQAAAAPAHAASAEQAAEKGNARKVEHAKKASKPAGQYENNGLNLAYLAKREAGDKLGSRAVRPALHQKRAKAAPVEQAEAVSAPGALITQAGQLVPGSTAGLQAALELARTGQTARGASEQAQPNLQGIVAAVQAQNSQLQAESVAVNASAQQAVAEPVTRKVRYTTNIPKSANTKKKADQAIRMLNVDNAGVNSKQGQGIAAYHAQQEASGRASEAGAVNVQSAAAPVAPLKAATEAAATETDAGFAIPPLRPGSLQG